MDVSDLDQKQYSLSFNCTTHSNETRVENKGADIGYKAKASPYISEAFVLKQKKCLLK